MYVRYFAVRLAQGSAEGGCAEAMHTRPLQRHTSAQLTPSPGTRTSVSVPVALPAEPCLQILSDARKPCSPYRQDSNKPLWLQVAHSGADSQAAAGLAHASHALPVHRLLRCPHLRLPGGQAPVLRLPGGWGLICCQQHAVAHGRWPHDRPHYPGVGSLLCNVRVKVLCGGIDVSECAAEAETCASCMFPSATGECCTARSAWVFRAAAAVWSLTQGQDTFSVPHVTARQKTSSPGQGKR